MDEDTGKRVKVTALMDADLVNWVDQMVKKKVFHNRSHGLERAVYLVRKHPEILSEDLTH